MTSWLQVFLYSVVIFRREKQKIIDIVLWQKSLDQLLPVQKQMTPDTACILDEILDEELMITVSKPTAGHAVLTPK